MYKIETIKNSIVYTIKVVDQLPKIYYLVFWKDYSKKENT